jgi:hypothetical protein
MEKGLREAICSETHDQVLFGSIVTTAPPMSLSCERQGYLGNEPAQKGGRCESLAGGNFQSYRLACQGKSASVSVADDMSG